MRKWHLLSIFVTINLEEPSESICVVICAMKEGCVDKSFKG